ncbi:hypothetical protein EYF80_060011 [Liparis tanakae]|uniref:Uncharacterized protein n=1 Tax=Liparis tanakae TaxID=230148 RepID=A0A4Z2EM29_9TELE|nr:hypothetical protein EYF80_060011 [Liparis tanakae]
MLPQDASFVSLRLHVLQSPLQHVGPHIRALVGSGVSFRVEASKRVSRIPGRRLASKLAHYRHLLSFFGN